MTVVVNDAALAFLLKSPSGPVGLDLERRAARVLSGARENASGAILGIDTGDLLAGLHMDIGEDVEGLFATVSTPAKHPWGGHADFAYPAFHDRTGRPWLTRALAERLRA